MDWDRLKEARSVMTEELTYYCSENVFLSFLESKKLWLTSLSQSNDSAEGRWMRDHWLSRFSKNKRLERRGAEICMDTASYNCLALGVCFSEGRDLLSQWRGYAADGAGFSISFDREILQRVAYENHESKLELIKIAYGDQDYEDINEVVRLLDKAFGADAKSYNESDGSGSLHLDFGTNGEKHDTHEKALRALFKVKNGAFREEKEWRLFTFGNLSSIGGVQLRGTGKAISPYLPITIPAESVTQVTRGPNNQTPLHVLEFALKNNGLSRTRARSSVASYRAR